MAHPIMALPEVIEITPLDAPVSALITVPGSKSITNRALILAALAEGETVLRGALWSEDTQIMTEALRQLGFAIDVEPDAKEFCNRTIRVGGLGGRIPNGGTPEKPLSLFVGNAGTAARFLAALVCLGRGVYRLHGSERRCAAWVTASIPPMIGCRSIFTGPGRVRQAASSIFPKVRNSPPRSCCAPASAVGKWPWRGNRRKRHHTS